MSPPLSGSTPLRWCCRSSSSCCGCPASRPFPHFLGSSAVREVPSVTASTWMVTELESMNVSVVIGVCLEANLALFFQGSPPLHTPPKDTGRRASLQQMIMVLDHLRYVTAHDMVHSIAIFAGCYSLRSSHQIGYMSTRPGVNGSSLTAASALC